MQRVILHCDMNNRTLFHKNLLTRKTVLAIMTMKTRNIIRVIIVSQEMLCVNAFVKSCSCFHERRGGIRDAKSDSSL